MSKQEKILAAALQIVAEKGPHDASVDEIAERAGVGKGTVYLYFRNKDTLLAALIQNGINTVVTAIRERVQKETDPRSQLIALISEHVTQLHQHMRYSRILWVQSSHVSLPVELKQELLKAAEGYHQFLGSILERGKEAGCFSISDAKITARAIIGSINNTAFAFTDPAQTIDLNQAINTLTEFILNGVSQVRR